MADRTFKVNLLGDVMLGRLLDQMLPFHVDEPSEAKIVASFLARRPDLDQYTPESPWGSTLPMLRSSDLNLINLETSATTHAVKWPNKTFNYRMHPNNIEVLKAGRIDYAGLANNHTLDFCEKGLHETVETVRNANIAFAGAGLSRDEAVRPALLTLPRSQKEVAGSPRSYKVQVIAASDHPGEWSPIPEFHFISYDSTARERLKFLITSGEFQPRDSPPALRIFSVHWGPNYTWEPSSNIRNLARYLIEECGVDIIHGHSSHHVQGVEIYLGKLIIYGCGDFVDDYALVPEYRNDLSAIWRVQVNETERGLRLQKLEIFPTKVVNFQATQLSGQDADHQWLVERIRSLSDALGTQTEKDLGPEGQLIINIKATNNVQ